MDLLWASSLQTENRALTFWPKFHRKFGNHIHIVCIQEIWHSFSQEEQVFNVNVEHELLK